MRTDDSSSLPLSYLVRFYRRDPANAESLAGIVQQVGKDSTPNVFHSCQELLIHLGIDGAHIQQKEADSASSNTK